MFTTGGGGWGWMNAGIHKTMATIGMMTNEKGEFCRTGLMTTKTEVFPKLSHCHLVWICNFVPHKKTLLMSNQEGFWYSVGRFFYKCFEGLEWTYDHISPNKILIVVGFVAVTAWVVVQHKYNKKSASDGSLK